MTQLEVDLLRRATMDLIESIKRIEETMLEHIAESPEYEASQIAKNALVNYKALGIDILK